MKYQPVRFILVAATAILAVSSFPGLLTRLGLAEEGTKTDSDEKAMMKEALSELNMLIGGWRGVGMPKRFSNDGSWKEMADFVWNFEKGQVAIDYKIEDSQLLKTASLKYDPKAEEYLLAAVTPEGDKRTYQGKFENDKLTLKTDANDEGLVYRLTLRPLNPKRTMVLHERGRKGSSLFVRIAEVGYTREGTRLAGSDSTEPECVVTGGAGTSQVSYKGKKYWICCTGCRQAFDADPEGVIAEYKARLAKKAKEKATN